MKEIPNIGIDNEVCKKVKCKYKYVRTNDRQDSWEDCRLMNCDTSDESGIGTYEGCPIPEKCPHKSLHILKGDDLSMCGREPGETACPMVIQKNYYSGK